MTSTIGKIKKWQVLLAVVATALSLQLLVDVGRAGADTAPPAGTPATVSDDPLPTVQIDGVVRAQVVVGNTVYVTGQFTHARPAGAAPGVNQVSRGNLLAYDITTGVLINSFNHSLSSDGRALAVSPDGTRLYVGGAFTTVDGVKHPHVAAFDLTNGGALLSTFTAGTSGNVYSLAATNSTVYVGGSFTGLSSGPGRTRAAAWTKAGVLLPWAPAENSQVSAMVMSPDVTKVILAGTFSTINGATYHNIGAVDPVTGLGLPWASQNATYEVQQDDPTGASSGITSLSENATTVFFSDFNYGAKTTKSFEGTGAIDPTDGHIVWLDDCHGDTYDAFPIGPVLYSVSHAHDCAPAGAFPEHNPRYNWRALAETITVDGVNGKATNGYPSHQGQPRSTQLDWYPNLTVGTVTGATQAAWSVTGNASYVSLGGEFPKVNNKSQQGLVRYAIASIAPNAVGPTAYAGYGALAKTAGTAGTTPVTVTPTWDPDNAVLTYKVYRNGGTTPVSTFTVDSRFWSLPNHVFTDTGLTPGSSPYYRITATDPFGNSTTTYTLFDDINGGVAYAGSWTNATGHSTLDYNGGVHVTSTNGSSATFTFTGTNVAFVTEKRSDAGNASISIDGGAATTVSTTATTTAYQQTVFSKTGLSAGTHTIKITKTSGTNLYIDGFLVK